MIKCYRTAGCALVGGFVTVWALTGHEILMLTFIALLVPWARVWKACIAATETLAEDWLKWRRRHQHKAVLDNPSVDFLDISSWGRHPESQGFIPVVEPVPGTGVTIPLDTQEALSS